jgi:hypothetical protein
MCSDSDVFVKEGSHFDSDLSGEFYASPNTPADGGGVGGDMIDQVSSLLRVGNANLNGASLMLSLNESSSNSPDASVLLFQIDGKGVGEEKWQVVVKAEYADAGREERRATAKAEVSVTMYRLHCHHRPICRQS